MNIIECSICLDKLNNKTIVKTSCNHQYHYDCLHIWITTNKKINKDTLCPLCNFKFLKFEIVKHKNSNTNDVLINLIKEDDDNDLNCAWCCNIL